MRAMKIFKRSGLRIMNVKYRAVMLDGARNQPVRFFGQASGVERENADIE